MKNYGGIDEKFSSLASAKIGVLPVPYDGTSTWIKGADKGPQAIIEASENMELYDIETNSEVYRKGIHTYDPVTEKSSPEKMTDTVYQKAKEILKEEKFLVTLGGEHSVSTGAVKAHHEKYQNMAVLQLDAHTDLRDEYEGSRYNHACVMSRIGEMVPFVQVGIRSMDIEEKKFIKKKNIFFFF